MFDENRPKITLTKTNTQRFIEIAIFVCVAFCFLYPALYYSSLPDQVPMHFNYKGEVDRYGSKDSVWGLAIIGALTAFGLYKLSQHPHIFNYPVKITKDNAEKFYKDSVKMLSYVNLLIAILFATICYQVVNIALNNDNQFGQWSEYLIYFILGLLTIGPLVWVIVNIFTSSDKKTIKH